MSKIKLFKNIVGRVRVAPRILFRAVSNPRKFINLNRANLHFHRYYKWSEQNRVLVEPVVAKTNGEAEKKIIWDKKAVEKPVDSKRITLVERIRNILIRPPVVRSCGNYQSEWDMRINYQFIRGALSKHPLVKGAKIVSIGCGFGSQELLLAKENKSFRVIGVDASDNAINGANSIKKVEFNGLKDRVSFKVGKFLDFVLPEKKFDCVMAIDSFHWAGDRFLALKRMKALIDPTSKNRLLVISYRPEGSLNQEKLQFPGGSSLRDNVRKSFTPDLVCSDLEKLGFAVQKTEALSSTKAKMVMLVARLK